MNAYRAKLNINSNNENKWHIFHIFRHLNRYNEYQSNLELRFAVVLDKLVCS
jgi:hypothetical protein